MTKRTPVPQFEEQTLLETIKFYYGLEEFPTQRNLKCIALNIVNIDIV